MYTNTNAVPRTDISALLEEAVEMEKNFIGQLVLPVYESETENGRYPKFKIGPGGLLKREATRRNDSGTYNEVDRKFDWETFVTEEFGLEERIDDKVAKRFANWFDAEVVTAKFVMRALMIDYEIVVAATVMNASTFTATASSVAYTEGNILTFDLAYDIGEAQARLEAVGEAANTIIMSRKVFNRIRRSKLLQLFMFGFLSAEGGNRLINEQMLAATFGVENFWVTKASYDLAAKNKGPTLGPIWGSDYIFVGNVQGGDFMNGGIGRTCIWEADSPGGLFTTESYRAEHRRGNMVRVRSNRGEVIINANAGQLITTQFA
jgi:hypothetical protein